MMSKRIATIDSTPKDTIRVELGSTKRVTVKVPTITRSYSSRRLREKNREIVNSIRKNNNRRFMF